MPSSVWKLTALLGVIAVGCLVVMQAQQGLTRQAEAKGSKQFLELDAEAGTPSEPTPADEELLAAAFPEIDEPAGRASLTPTPDDGGAGAPPPDGQSEPGNPFANLPVRAAEAAQPFPEQAEPAPAGDESANPFAESAPTPAADGLEALTGLTAPALPQSPSDKPAPRAESFGPGSEPSPAVEIAQVNGEEEVNPFATTPQNRQGSPTQPEQFQPLTSLPPEHPGPILMATPNTARPGASPAVTNAALANAGSFGQPTLDSPGRDARSAAVPATGADRLAPHDVLIPFAPASDPQSPPPSSASNRSSLPQFSLGESVPATGRPAPPPRELPVMSLDEAGFDRSPAAVTPPPVDANPFAAAPPTSSPPGGSGSASSLPGSSVPVNLGPVQESPAQPSGPDLFGAAAPAGGSIPTPRPATDLGNPFATGSASPEPAQEAMIIRPRGSNASTGTATGAGFEFSTEPEGASPDPVIGGGPTGVPEVSAPAINAAPRDNAIAPADTLPAVDRSLTGDGVVSRDAPTGPQQPELRIEKEAPGQAIINEPLDYAIRVRNVGASAARGVEVEDRIPRGTMLYGTIPQAELDERTKKLTWKLGTIEPGGESLIKIRVIPQTAGEVGSVATVRFVAEVSASTVVTAPELGLHLSGPSETVVGESPTFKFVITNSGSGDARGVYIRNLLPEGLIHEGGSDLEYEVGDIKAGESREVQLTLQATKAGQVSNRARVTINGDSKAETAVDVRILESRLTISRTGPARRFVGRPAAFTNRVTNSSSQPLQNITVVESLPEGVDIAGLPQGGHFDPAQRTITWKIPRLDPGRSLDLVSNVVAGQAGELQGKVTAFDDGKNHVEAISRLDVAGISNLEVVVKQQQAVPVAVGEQVALRMTIQNRGTEAARNVETVFEIPAEMEFVTAEGPVRFVHEQNQVRFATIGALPEGAQESFDIVLTAAEESTDARVKVTLNSDQQTDLKDEESVVIFADR